MTVYVQRQRVEKLLTFECQECECDFEENRLWIIDEHHATIAAFWLPALSAWWVEKDVQARTLQVETNAA